MRLIALLFAVTVAAPPAPAESAQTSSRQPSASATQDSAQARTQGQSTTKDQESKDQEPGLPVSLDKIKDALKQPPSALTLRTVDGTPTFRMQILEKQKIEELLATLFLKSTPGPFGGYTPGGGLYGFEQQRQMFPAVDNPLRQPYAAFSGGELLTILIENLIGRYLGGRALEAVSHAERNRAEAAAKEEVRNAVTQYCAAQPNGGAGLQICGTTIR
jgi:hypothetical protein